VVVGDDLGMIKAFLGQLALNFDVDLIVDDENKEGTIKFKKINNYKHPSKMDIGLNLPKRIHYFTKTLEKHTDSQILGSHNLYLNDIHNKISRLSEPFQFLSVKYSFKDLMNLVWFDTTTTCFQFKDDIPYILGKVQCQNSEGKKWFGDTFILKENEKIIKCIWYKDPELKQFFTCLKFLVKDILNLYLNLGDKGLKQKKINLKSVDVSSLRHKVISNLLIEKNLSNLVENIQKLESYDTFYPIFKNLLDQKKKDGLILHSNIEHIFKDELLPSFLTEEECSLMTMNDPEFVGGNYFYLMDHILSENEKLIFRSKI
jgi:hypothetical protein